MDIRFERITYDNLELACSIQNEIFPEEDARVNFVEQIERNPYRKEMDYNIAFIDGVAIGVTGIYVYPEYPEDAWLGWFGVLEKYRKNGYGKVILEKTIKMAKDKGYNYFRLYTDEFAKDAHKLYESFGMIKELYDNKDDKDKYIDADIYVYSLSICDKTVSKWDNKMLGLREQSDKEH